MFICFFTCMSEACMVAHAMAADRQTSGIMGEKKHGLHLCRSLSFFLQHKHTSHTKQVIAIGSSRFKAKCNFVRDLLYPYTAFA